MKENWTKIGKIGVDSGLCWIGDPCYINEEDNHPLKNWHKFLDIFYGEDESTFARSFKYEKGHEGLGVCVSTGYGDGSYNIYAKFYQDSDSRSHKRIKEIKIVFIGDKNE